MEKKLFPLTDPPLYSSPQQALEAFREAYTPEAAQDELWRWFILLLKQDYDGLTSPRTIRLITFYENLKEIISAVYQLPVPPPQPAPIAEALQALSDTFNQNWTLLISPPE